MTSQIYNISGRVSSIDKNNSVYTVTIASTAEGKIAQKGGKAPLENYFYKPNEISDKDFEILKEAKYNDAGVTIYFTSDQNGRNIVSVTAYVSLTINNNSGEDLIIAFLQGGLPHQTVDQLKWLNFAHLAYWENPKNPTKDSDLAPYMQKVKKGQSVVINVPNYDELVGFRCLVADTTYKTKALKQYKSKFYMAFPNLEKADYVYDKFEAGLTKNVTGIWNITSVDFLALPMQLIKNGEKVGYKDGVTQEGMFKELSKLTSPYSSGGTQSPNTSTQTYRFFSPAHIPTAINAMDTQITKGLKNLKSNSFTVHYGADVFSNFTASSKTITGNNGDSYICGTVSCTSKNNGPITVDDVTSTNAFAGTIGINGNSSQVLLGALLAAALCRGVLENPNKWGDITYTSTQCASPWYYYTQNTDYDAYSKLIHQYSIDGKNYAFSYDDYFADEAGFNVLPGDSVSLNILPVNGKLTAKANTRPTAKDGCLAITIPNAAVNNLGSLIVNSKKLDAVTNKLCFLDTKVKITFINYPATLTNPELHIDLSKITEADAISYWEKGKKSSKLSITGLVYIPAQRQLTFAAISSWSLT